MVKKLGITLALIVALPVVYVGLFVVFVVTASASMLEGLGKVWK